MKNSDTFDFDSLFDEAHSDSKSTDMETLIKKDEQLAKKNNEDVKKTVSSDDFDFEEMFNEETPVEKEIKNEVIETELDEEVSIDTNDSDVNEEKETVETISDEKQPETIKDNQEEVNMDDDFTFDETDIKEDIKKFEENKKTETNKVSEEIVEEKKDFLNEVNTEVVEVKEESKIELKQPQKEVKKIEPLITPIEDKTKKDSNTSYSIKNIAIAAIVMLVVWLGGGYFLWNQNTTTKTETVEKIVEKKVTETVETKSYYLYFRNDDVLAVSNETSKLNAMRFDDMKNRILSKLDTKYDTEEVVVTEFNGKAVNFKTTFKDLKTWLLKLKEETITLNNKTNTWSVSNTSTGKVSETKDVVNNLK